VHQSAERAIMRHYLWLIAIGGLWLIPIGGVALLACRATSGADDGGALDAARDAVAQVAEDVFPTTPSRPRPTVRPPPLPDPNTEEQRAWDACWAPNADFTGNGKWRCAGKPPKSRPVGRDSGK